MKRFLISGGYGLIDSYVVKLFLKKCPQYQVVNLADLFNIEMEANYMGICTDVSDQGFVNGCFESYDFDRVIKLTDEPHADRLIVNQLTFVGTNAIGMVTLLNKERDCWKNYDKNWFYGLSTGDLCESLGEEGVSLEYITWNSNCSNMYKIDC